MSSPKMIPTSVRMDGKTVTAFRDAAARERRSVAELIREATKAYVNRHDGFNKPIADPQVTDAARRKNQPESDGVA